MRGSSENATATLRVSGEGRRAGREVVLETVFRPMSRVLVRPLAALHVPPTAVVLANVAAGGAAAVMVAEENLVLGAVLLQVKTLLDNTDGQLARATGRVTLTGRYLDTIGDLLVNVALFVALAHVTGRPLVAAAAFIALTFVLAVDFNVSELAREAAGLAQSEPLASASRGERAIGAVYGVVFAPQDRLIRTVSANRLLAAVGSAPRPEQVDRARAEYFDAFTLTTLANLGLTTQLAVLGLCLLAEAPTLYLWLAIASFVALLPLQLRRERNVRRAVRA